MHASDLDSDGDIDLIYVCFQDGEIVWAENQGGIPLVFNQTPISNTTFGVCDIFLTDFNGDGSLDVLSANLFAKSIVLHQNDGASPPSFSDMLLFTTPDFPNHILAADLDGDGDVDVITGSFSGEQLFWYENLDGSNFVSHFIAEPADPFVPDTPLVGGIRGLFVSDLDGDGDLDFAVISGRVDGANGRLAWFENDGAAPPSFVPHLLNINLDRPQGVHVADLNGDGNPDILTAVDGDDTVAWYENDGAMLPTFTRRVIDSGLRGAQSVFAIDLDLDGDMDVLAAGSIFESFEPPTPNIVITNYMCYENLGLNSATFSGSSIRGRTEDHQVVIILAADLDGDGDAEPIFAQNDGPPGFGYSDNLTIVPRNATRDWMNYE